MIKEYDDLTRLEVLHIIKEYIKPQMKRQKISVAELAESIGINYNTLSSYFKNGGVKMPFEIFKEVCTYVDLEKVDLIEKAKKNIF